MLAPPVPSAAPAGLAWLTNWGGQPLTNSEPFDIARIQPDTSSPTATADSLLEVTIWDLYEPGKPHTFPVRVSSGGTIDVPLVGEVAIGNAPLREIEATLAKAYQAGEILLAPRVLVRSLDAQRIKVHVAGAVNRTGFVELSRDDPSLFAALVSAGGLKKNAGTHVSISRRTAHRTASAGDALHQPQSTSGEPHPGADADADAGTFVPAAAPVAAHANSSETVSVRVEPSADENLTATPDGRQPTEISNQSQALQSSRARGSSEQTQTEQQLVWFDLSLESGRKSAIQFRLQDGDTVKVRSVTLPIRISGSVARPGAYALPVGRSMNAWQALELAGGMTVAETPTTLILFRPANEGHASQRWFLNQAAGDKTPPAAPAVEAGDMIHVEPSTGSAIKQAMGQLFSR